MADQSDIALADGEVELDDSSELLWRNANPGWVDGDRLTSQLFRPTPKDNLKLSTARSAVISAEGHFTEFTVILGLRSVGVWAVSVGEVLGQRTRAIDDSESINKPDPCPTGHTYIDFRRPTNVRRVAGNLRDAALARGCQHPPS